VPRWPTLRIATRVQSRQSIRVWLAASLATVATNAAAAGEDAGAGATAPNFVRYLEWVLDVRLSAAQLDEANGLVARAASSPNVDDRRLIVRAVELEQELAGHSETELASLRWSVEDEYLKSLRGRYRSSSVARWILKVKADATRPLTPGKPPLTRLAADCLTELSAFVLGEARGSRTAADPATRAALGKELVAAWPLLSDAERLAVTAAPSEWARLRAGWASADDGRREQLREIWRGLLTPDAGEVKTLALAAIPLAVDAPRWR